MRRGGDARDAAGQGCLHSGGSQHGQHIATVRAALQRAKDSRALFGADEAAQLLVVFHVCLLVVRGGYQSPTRAGSPLMSRISAKLNASLGLGSCPRLTNTLFTMPRSCA